MVRGEYVGTRENETGKGLPNLEIPQVPSGIPSNGPKFTKAGEADTKENPGHGNSNPNTGSQEQYSYFC